MPCEIDDVLTRHPDFGRVLDWRAEPEVRLRLDRFPGEPRNTDLLVELKDAQGPFLMAVEAKADEPFGELLGDALAAAIDRKLANPRSNGILRIQQLCTALLGPRGKGSVPAKRIRYQLLTACAGVLAEAERRCCTRALMLVQEFDTPRTTAENHRRNAHDFDAFIRRLSCGTVAAIKHNEIVGPFVVPGEPLLSVPTQLYIGKTRRAIH